MPLIPLSVPNTPCPYPLWPVTVHASGAVNSHALLNGCRGAGCAELLQPDTSLRANW